MKRQKVPYLVVEIEDAKFYFEPVGYRSWIELVELQKLDLAKQIEFVMKRLMKVENYFDENGVEYTADGARSADLSFEEGGPIVVAWSDALAKKLNKPGAEAKNEVTADSPDSSSPVSTSPA